MAWLASHELEGAVDEGARVSEGGGVVVNHHNVEQLRRRHGRRGWSLEVAGRREGGGAARWLPLSLVSPGSSGLVLILIRLVSSD